MASGTPRKRLTYEEFFRRAVLRLRDTSKSLGIHSVYSGFNQAFREYYGEDPVPVTQQLARDGKIVMQPRRGGVMIYLPEDAPGRLTVRETLSKILDEDELC